MLPEIPNTKLSHAPTPVFKPSEVLPLSLLPPVSFASKTFKAGLYANIRMLRKATYTSFCSSFSRTISSIPVPVGPTQPDRTYIRTWLRTVNHCRQHFQKLLAIRNIILFFASAQKSGISSRHSKINPF